METGLLVGRLASISYGKLRMVGNSYISGLVNLYWSGKSNICDISEILRAFVKTEFVVQKALAKRFKTITKLSPNSDCVRTAKSVVIGAFAKSRPLKPEEATAPQNIPTFAHLRATHLQKWNRADFTVCSGREK